MNIEIKMFWHFSFILSLLIIRHMAFHRIQIFSRVYFYVYIYGFIFHNFGRIEPVDISGCSVSISPALLNINNLIKNIVHNIMFYDCVLCVKYGQPGKHIGLKD